MPSFDVVSNVSIPEVDNAIDQASRELKQRYDFKNSKSSITREDKTIVLIADDDYKLRSLTEILEIKLQKRGVILKSLKYGKPEQAFSGCIRQRVEIQVGIPPEVSRNIVKDIKNLKMKVQAAIQGDQVRVSGKKKDDLQEVIAFLRSRDYGLPLQFTNYREN